MSDHGTTPLLGPFADLEKLVAGALAFAGQQPGFGPEKVNLFRVWAGDASLRRLFEFEYYMGNSGAPQQLSVRVRGSGDYWGQHSAMLYACSTSQLVSAGVEGYHKPINGISRFSEHYTLLQRRLPILGWQVGTMERYELVVTDAETARSKYPLTEKKRLPDKEITSKQVHNLIARVQATKPEFMSTRAFGSDGIGFSLYTGAEAELAPRFSFTLQVRPEPSFYPFMQGILKNRFGFDIAQHQLVVNEFYGRNRSIWNHGFDEQLPVPLSEVLGTA